MAKYLAFLGTSGAIENSKTLPIKERMQIAGINTGNLAFQRAAAKIFANDRHFIGRSGVDYNDPSAYRGIDYLVFPAANHLRLNADWTGLTSFLKNSPAPLIILGLGAQAKALEGDEASIDALCKDDNVLRFVEVLQKKAALVTVRGAFTKSVCDAMGLENTLPLGCPSLFLNDDPKMGVRIERQIQSLANDADEAPLKFGLAAAAPNEITEGSPLRPVEQWLFSNLVAGNGLYIQQSGGLAAESYAAGANSELSLQDFLSLKNALYCDGSFDDFIPFMATRQRIYWSIDTWQEQVKDLPLIIGTRLHGNMLALSTGKPGVFIGHDSRTTELISAMKLPRASFSDVVEAGSARQLLKKVVFDGADFDKNRYRIAAEYAAQFEKLELSLSDGIRALAEAYNPEEEKPIKKKRGWFGL